MRTVRRPAPPQSLHGRLRRKAPHGDQPLHRLAQPEVARGQHIVPTQVKDQVHLGGPPADPADPGELGNHLLIRQFAQPSERDGPVQHLARQVSEVADLLRREAGAAERGVGRVTKPLRAGKLGSPAGRHHLAADRRARRSTDLLEDDRAHQRRETFGLQRGAKRPRSVDQRAEPGVRSLKGDRDFPIGSTVHGPAEGGDGIAVRASVERTEAPADRCLTSRPVAAHWGGRPGRLAGRGPRSRRALNYRPSRAAGSRPQCLPFVDA